MHKKYIRKNGKTFGPYLYEVNRVNGKIITTYLGKAEPLWKQYWTYVVLCVAILMVVGYFLGDLNYFTGKVTENIDIDSSAGEMLAGTLELRLDAGEFIPRGTRLNIKSGESEAVFELSELVSGSATEGEFFLNGSNLNGSGLGYGDNASFILVVNLSVANLNTSSTVSAVASYGDVQLFTVMKETIPPVEPVIIIENDTVEEIVESTEVDINANVENIPNNSIITTMQSGEVEINKPVLWRKNVKFHPENPGLPKAAENINSRNISSDEYELEYETPAPSSIEYNISSRQKDVIIYAPEGLNYTNITVHSELPIRVSEGEKKLVKLYLIANGNSVEHPFSLEDMDSDGLLERASWIAPEIGSTFEIIVVTQAEHLNSNREFVEDIYESVKSRDSIWSPIINSDEYVRATFEKNLTNGNDITIYPRIISGDPRIEVYEVGGNDTLLTFYPINDVEYNKEIFTTLSNSQDTFDLRVLGGAVQFDHIIDPFAIFFDDFEDNNMDGWTVNGWATAADGALGSSYQASASNGAGESMVIAIDASGYYEIYFRFYAITVALDAGDYLNVEYYNESGWNSVLMVEDLVSWTPVASQLLGVDNYPNLQIRFTCYSGRSESCGIDNVNLTATLDMGSPAITINSPSGNVTQPASFQVTLNEVGNACNYSLNGGISNSSMTSSGGTIWSATNSSLGLGGPYNISFYCWDTSNNFNQTNTSFHILEYISLSSCGNLSSPYTTYKLTQDISSIGTCINITAPGITLDGQGYTVTYANTDAVGNGIHSGTNNYTTIKNLNVVQNNTVNSLKHGIVVQGSHSTLSNISVRVNGLGMYAINTEDMASSDLRYNNSFSNIDIVMGTTGSSFSAHFYRLEDSTITNMNITHLPNTDAFYVFQLVNVTVENLSVYSGATSQEGMVLTSLSNYLTFNNAFVRTNGSTASSVEIYATNYNVTFNNPRFESRYRGFRTLSTGVSASELIIINPNITAVGAAISQEKVTTLKGQLIFNNSFGQISFTGFGTNLTVLKGNLSLDDRYVQIRNNSVFVNSSFYSGAAEKINSGANVTFYNLPTNFESPKILRDGDYVCASTTTPSCYNFTSLNAGTVVFNVSSWSDYSIVELPYIPVPNCGKLDIPDTIYKLTKNIINDTISSACLNITASGVTIDCAGYYLKSAKNYTGVHTNKLNSKILNCNISMGSGGNENAKGISLATGANYTNVTNNTIQGGMYEGINIYASSFNTISHNNILNGGGYGGIQILAFSQNNTIENNLIQASGSYAYALYLYSTKDSIARNNLLYYWGVNGYALYASSDNNIIENNTLYTNHSTNVGLYIAANNSYFINNVINVSAGSAIYNSVVAAKKTNHIIFNNSFGEIIWTNLSFRQNMTMLQNKFFLDDSYVQIKDNYVFLNSSYYSATGGRINSSANITLRGLPTDFINPKIYRDGEFECNSTTVPSCYNFTSLNAGTVVFNVSSWSNYSIIGEVQGGALSVYLSDNLTSSISWDLTSLPVSNLAANANNGSGKTLYFVNLTVDSGAADIYLKANGNLANAGGDILGLGNETYNLNMTDSSVPGSNRLMLTTNYADNKIGSNLASGEAVYLKFYLNAPAAQPAGTYNNSISFKIVIAGQAP